MCGRCAISWICTNWWQGSECPKQQRQLQPHRRHLSKPNFRGQVKPSQANIVVVQGGNIIPAVIISLDSSHLSASSTQVFIFDDFRHLFDRICIHNYTLILIPSAYQRCSQTLSSLSLSSGCCQRIPAQPLFQCALIWSLIGDGQEERRWPWRGWAQGKEVSFNSVVWLKIIF